MPARYCPSFEDKIVRFPERDRHQIILEPEGLDTQEIYASGLGNSLPLEVQIQVVRCVSGLEQAEIMRPAYAIEYDFIDPVQLRPTLETKRVKGLFLAGQINGTSDTRKRRHRACGPALMPPVRCKKGRLLSWIAARPTWG